MPREKDWKVIVCNDPRHLELELKDTVRTYKSTDWSVHSILPARDGGFVLVLVTFLGSEEDA